MDLGWALRVGVLVLEVQENQLPTLVGAVPGFDAQTLTALQFVTLATDAEDVSFGADLQVGASPLVISPGGTVPAEGWEGVAFAAHLGSTDDATGQESQVLDIGYDERYIGTPVALAAVIREVLEMTAAEPHAPLSRYRARALTAWGDASSPSDG